MGEVLGFGVEEDFGVGLDETVGFREADGEASVWFIVAWKPLSGVG